MAAAGQVVGSSHAATCMKLLLTIFNFVFWLSGVAVLALGIWMKVELYVYMELTTVYYEAAPYILIGIGAGIMVFGTFGCICTVKGHGCLLYLFAVFLLLVFVLEFATAIAAFVYKSTVEEGFHKGLNDAMHAYSYNAEKAKAVDGIQKGMHCCGSAQYTDWYNISWSGQPPSHTVPTSCCETANCDGSKTTNIYHEGCYKILTSFMESNFLMIGGIAIGFAFLQLLGALLACCLAKNVNRLKYEQMA